MFYVKIINEKIATTIIPAGIQVISNKLNTRIQNSWNQITTDYKIKYKIGFSCEIISWNIIQNNV